jgi:hypothetical protein
MIRRLESCLFIFSIFLSLSGCVSATPQATSKPETITQIAAESTPPVTKTPNSTLTPSATPSKIPSITPSATPTLLPSLEPEAAQIAIRDLLMQDARCESACIWGMIPDRTTFQEAQNVFSHLNIPLNPTYQDGDRHFYQADYKFGDGLDGITTLIEQDGYVRDVTVGFHNPQRPSKPDTWLSFSPRAILERYGPPTAVYLHVNLLGGGPAPKPEFTEYDMTLYYENSNLIVRFRDGLGKPGALVRACPLTDSFSGAGIWLGREPHNPPSMRVSLEEATSLDLEQFYNLLMQDPEKACFNIREDVFAPKP